jgi:hypothetical protein
MKLHLWIKTEGYAGQSTGLWQWVCKKCGTKLFSASPPIDYGSFTATDTPYNGYRYSNVRGDCDLEVVKFVVNI